MKIAILHAGADQSRADEVNEVFRRCGYPTSSRIIREVSVGRETVQEMAQKGKILERNMRVIDRASDSNANALMVDWEPSGEDGQTDWNGKKDTIDPEDARMFAGFVAACKRNHADVGVYGFPYNRWWQPHTTRAGLESLHAVHLMEELTAFYPSIYMTHQTGEHAPDAGRVRERFVCDRIAATLAQAREVAQGRPIRPMYQGRLRHPGKDWNLQSIEPQSAAVWWGAVANSGIDEAVWWFEHSGVDTRIREVEEQAGAIVSAIEKGIAA